MADYQAPPGLAGAENAATARFAAFAFDPSREKYVERARIKVSDSPTWAHPVVAGSRIYIKSEMKLAAFELNEPSLP